MIPPHTLSFHSCQVAPVSPIVAPRTCHVKCFPSVWYRLGTSVCQVRRDHKGAGSYCVRQEMQLVPTELWLRQQWHMKQSRFLTKLSSPPLPDTSGMSGLIPFNRLSVEDFIKNKPLPRLISSTSNP